MVFLENQVKIREITDFHDFQEFSSQNGSKPEIPFCLVPLVGFEVQSEKLKKNNSRNEELSMSRCA